MPIDRNDKVNGVSTETYVKAQILARGVRFSEGALLRATSVNAKLQNLNYNLPLNAASNRPQELLLTGADGYETVVSCVSPTGRGANVLVDIDANGDLTAAIDGALMNGLAVAFVTEPEYYLKPLSNGEIAKKYVSACGYDELNILPWKGCAISEVCKFCGVNSVAQANTLGDSSASSMKSYAEWEDYKPRYLPYLKEAVELAIGAECYRKHAHVILISGNLSDKNLDLQSVVFAEIAKYLHPSVEKISTEGIVAVITPPADLALIDGLKGSGVSVVVFNLEVANDPWFSRYCPGKSNIGRDFILARLEHAVSVFGKGNVWTNFVLGLEPIDKLLETCEQLARKGIASSANVLHLDHGNSLDCAVPDFVEIIGFFRELDKIIRKYHFKPLYCAKALRTSLANEASAGRM